MDEEMTMDSVIDAVAAGEISAEEGVQRLVAMGRTEQQARYEVASLATVDVRVN
jgi:ASC-1-like (ASCH) protein